MYNQSRRAVYKQARNSSPLLLFRRYEYLPFHYTTLESSMQAWFSSVHRSLTVSRTISRLSR